jgi:phosphatidylglycerol lysyltransferase
VRRFNFTILISTIIEITGILHVHTANVSVSINPLLDAAVALFRSIDDYFAILRGLGAVEFTMVYILTKFTLSQSSYEG